MKNDIDIFHAWSQMLLRKRKYQHTLSVRRSAHNSQFIGSEVLFRRLARQKNLSAYEIICGIKQILRAGVAIQRFSKWKKESAHWISSWQICTSGTSCCCCWLEHSHHVVHHASLKKNRIFLKQTGNAAIATTWYREAFKITEYTNLSRLCRAQHTSLRNSQWRKNVKNIMGVAKWMNEWMKE